MTRIDPILLGHNPLFGINHLSQEQGAAVAERFEEVGLLTELLLHCHGLGIRGMMMSSHPRAKVVCDVIGREVQLRDSWRVYPLLPYVQKYVRQANEKGLLNVVVDTLSQASLTEKLSLVMRGGAGLISKDLRQALCLLIDVELLPFKGRQLGAVFLHDALTDLALGLGAEAVLEVFRDHVTSKYGVPAGLATKNVPLLRERMDKRGLADVLVMGSFNPIGFYVNPSLEECASAIRKDGMRFVAMNTLASGAINPDEAYKFLAQFPAIESVVVGISRKDHADETVAAIRRHLPVAIG